jgi:hypothetical protein
VAQHRLGDLKSLIALVALYARLDDDKVERAAVRCLARLTVSGTDTFPAAAAARAPGGHQNA